MNLNLLGAVLGISVLLTGCSQSTLNLSHYSETKTTIIDMGKDRKYQIDNSEQVTMKQRAGSVDRGSSKSTIYVSSGVCSSIMFQHLPPLGRNQYYTNATKEDVYAQFKGLDCKTDAMGPLEFHECGSNYVVTYDAISDDEGFLTEKMYLIVKDKECFDQIKLAAKQ